MYIHTKSVIHTCETKTFFEKLIYYFIAFNLPRKAEKFEQK